jgi:hypothetical protein
MDNYNIINSLNYDDQTMSITVTINKHILIIIISICMGYFALHIFERMLNIN